MKRSYECSNGCLPCLYDQNETQQEINTPLIVCAVIVTLKTFKATQTAVHTQAVQ